MKHGAKNRSNTRKIINNNNAHTHTHTHARTHARTHHPPTHTLLFWLTNNLKHSINYNKTKFLKQQNTKIETFETHTSKLSWAIQHTIILLVNSELRRYANIS